MNTIVRLMLVFVVVMIVASPAFSAEATQIWKCEMDDAVTEKQVRDMAGEWLKAAKGMEGGQNLKAYVYFPVAVNTTGTSSVPALPFLRTRGGALRRNIRTESTSS